MPAINEFLDARQMSLEPLPNWFTRLKVLYRRAFPQSSSDPGLYSAFLAVQFKKGLEDPHLRDHMLRHECSEIKEALRIAVSAQQGLEAPLHLSRKPQPLAPGHCPTCGFRRPLPPSTKPRLNKSYRGGRGIKSRLATSRAGNRGGLRPPRPLPPG